MNYTVSSDNNGTAGPDAGITRTILLDNTGGYDVHTGLSTPFSDPGNVKITVSLFVNGQAVNYANTVICQGGEYTTAASDYGTSGGQNPSVRIQQIVTQQGSQACTASAGYIISAKITGAANAQASYTISSGNNGAIFAPDAAGATILLDNTGGYDVNFGVQGPFSDPGNVKITITVFVNGQAVNYANAVICQGGEYKYGTSVAPQVSNLTLSLDILRNATYHSPDWGEFQLSNGIYYRTPPTAQESPDIYTTHLLDTVFYGDINLDGFQDAVVFLSTQNGGTGHFVEMAAVLNLNGSPSNISTLYLGDRVVIESGAIQNGVITLNLLVQGPNDGLCCPSQLVTWNFHLDSGQVVKTP